MAVVVCAMSLASLQSGGGARRVFSDQADTYLLALCPKRMAGEGWGGVEGMLRIYGSDMSDSDGKSCAGREGSRRRQEHKR